MANASNFACMASCLSDNPQDFNQCDRLVIAALASTGCNMSTLQFESAMHTYPRDCSHVRLHTFATISEFGRVLAAEVIPWAAEAICCCLALRCEIMNVLLALVLNFCLFTAAVVTFSPL